MTKEPIVLGPRVRATFEATLKENGCSLPADGLDDPEIQSILQSAERLDGISKVSLAEARAAADVYSGTAPDLKSAFARRGPGGKPRVMPTSKMSAASPGMTSRMGQAGFDFVGEPAHTTFVSADKFKWLDTSKPLARVHEESTPNLYHREGATLTVATNGDSEVGLVGSAEGYEGFEQALQVAKDESMTGRTVAMLRDPQSERFVLFRAHENREVHDHRAGWVSQKKTYGMGTDDDVEILGGKARGVVAMVDGALMVFGAWALSEKLGP